MNSPARKIKSTIPQPPPATLEDFLAIPEEERRNYELIEGMLVPTKEVTKDATSGSHGGAQWALSAWLAPFGRRPGGRHPGGWWFATDTSIQFDAKNTLRPDVAGWRRDRVPVRPIDPVVLIRPDWVCEVLSTNRGADLIKKKRIYHRYEVAHYWIVDPVEQTLSVLRWGPDGYIEVQIGEWDEILHAEPFGVIPLQVKILFGDDPDEDLDESPPDESAGEP